MVLIALLPSKGARRSPYCIERGFITSPFPHSVTNHYEHGLRSNHSIPGPGLMTFEYPKRHNRWSTGSLRRADALDRCRGCWDRAYDQPEAAMTQHFETDAVLGVQIEPG